MFSFRTSKALVDRGLFRGGRIGVDGKQLFASDDAHLDHDLQEILARPSQRTYF